MKTELEKAAVIGAAGKMGSGIALLLLREMTLRSIRDNRQRSLALVDISSEAAAALRDSLKGHLKRFAEKKINLLRELYAGNESLVDNADMIAAFVEKGMETARFGIAVEEAKESRLIFEAVAEEIPLKAKIFRTLSELCPKETLFFSNTSSIPIGHLAKEGGIEGRLIGFHFYNPPAVQKLIEIIPPEGLEPELADFSERLAGELNKTVIFSADVAGFIGNGHFIPELLFACSLARELAEKMTRPEALFHVNAVTEELLLRPMGIFQLMDYVGVDVCHQIAKTMRRFLGDDSLEDRMISAMVEAKMLGGQNPDGSQKPGMFKYSGTAPTAIFDCKAGNYVPLAPVKEKASLGELPKGHLPWKRLVKEKDKSEKLAFYFGNLKTCRTEPAALARRYLRRSCEIAESLVERKVAASMTDVSAVLILGFHHLYGPDAPYLPIKEMAR